MARSFLDHLRARPATLVAAALVVLAVWEIGTLAAVKSATASDADWKAAAAHVDAGFAAGDLVVFAPTWADPVGRRWLGHRLSLDDLGRMDAARYARLWEVSIRGERAAETRGLSAVSSRSFGAVTVRRFDKKPATVHWRAHDRGEILEVAHTPRKCVRGTGRRDYPGVTLGSELVVYAGLADVWARKANRAYARVRVLVDGEVVSETSIGNSSGWVRLPAAATTPGGPHTVTLDVAIDPSRGDPKSARLDVCVAAEARTP